MLWISKQRFGKPFSLSEFQNIVTEQTAPIETKRNPENLVAFRANTGLWICGNPLDSAAEIGGRGASDMKWGEPA